MIRMKALAEQIGELDGVEVELSRNLGDDD